MGAPRAGGGLARLCRFAPTLAATAAGCALILLALQRDVPRPPSPTPTASHTGRSASVRGGLRVASRGAAPAAGREAAVPALRRASVVAPTPSPGEGTETPPPAPSPIPPRNEVIVYTVQPGDNLHLIAQRFNLGQDTIAWANPEVERDPDQLRIGQELSVLPVDGVLHTVQPGETLATIARRYRVELGAIVDYAPNGIADPSSLGAGQKLIIPGGIKPAASSGSGAAAPATDGKSLMIPAGAPETPVEAPAGPGRFAWPAQGTITQGYGKWHGAIDVANKLGTPIVATDAGTVTFAGPSGGLGNAIQIDHSDGFATTYAHLDTIGVQVGQGVAKGEQIGTMGTTGHSTGPHLHLIVQYNGGIVNPMDYLPQ